MNVLYNLGSTADAKRCFSFKLKHLFLSRYYRNELCFDATNGDTVASADLAKMTLDADEKALMKLWDDILAEAKRTANYDSRLIYGVYQITKELNTSHKAGTGRSQQTVYDCLTPIAVILLPFLYSSVLLQESSLQNRGHLLLLLLFHSALSLGGFLVYYPYIPLLHRVTSQVVL